MRRGEKLSEEQKRKMAEGRERAKAAREAKAVEAQAVDAAPPAVEAEEPRPRRRRKRRSLGDPDYTLDVPAHLKKKGLHYRWVNDRKGRPDRLYEQDYDYVEDENIRSHAKSGPVRRLVGERKDGSPIYAYLMSKPLEYYEEDQAEKQRKADEIDAQIRRAPKEMKEDAKYLYDEDIQYDPTQTI